MKIVVDARLINSSGIGTYIQSILPFLRERATLVLLGYPEEIDGFPWSEGLEVISERSAVYSIAEQFTIPAKVPKCDIYWSPHYNVPLLPLRARKRVVTVHDVYHLAFYHTLTLQQKIYASVMIRSAVGLSDMVITVSHFSKSEIEGRTNVSPRRNIEVIHNGIDHGTFRPNASESEKERVRRQYGLPESFILFVGDIKPHKNLPVLLRAFSTMCINGQDRGQKIVISGRREGLLTVAPGTDGIVDGLRLKDRVVFTGHVPKRDLTVFYNLADLFVFPSLYEGFGFPPLEAMACGCPVVCSDIPSLREVCADAALYVDPFDHESLCSAMIKALGDLEARENLIAMGTERSAIFGQKKSAAAHFDAIDRLVNDR